MRPSLFKISLLSIFILTTSKLHAETDPVSHMTVSGENECVILLHGLARTDASMRAMKSGLEKYTYRVVNVSYPSRKFDIPYLSNNYLPPSLPGVRVLRQVLFMW